MFLRRTPHRLFSSLSKTKKAISLRYNKNPYDYSPSHWNYLTRIDQQAMACIESISSGSKCSIPKNLFELFEKSFPQDIRVLHSERIHKKYDNPSEKITAGYFCLPNVIWLENPESFPSKYQERMGSMRVATLLHEFIHFLENRIKEKDQAILHQLDQALRHAFLTDYTQLKNLSLNDRTLLLARCLTDTIIKILAEYSEENYLKELKAYFAELAIPLSEATMQKAFPRMCGWFNEKFIPLSQHHLKKGIRTEIEELYAKPARLK